MQNDRELRAALEQALATTRRALDRVRAEQSEQVEQLEARAKIACSHLASLEAQRAETSKTRQALEQARRERDAISHQLEHARRRASEAERELVSLQVHGSEAPQIAAPSVGPAWSGPGRWLLRGAGLFLVGAFLAWGENLCGLFLGGGLLVASFLD